MSTLHRNENTSPMLVIFLCGEDSGATLYWQSGTYASCTGTLTGERVNGRRHLQSDCVDRSVGAVAFKSIRTAHLSLTHDIMLQVPQVALRTWQHLSTEGREGRARINIDLHQCSLVYGRNGQPKLRTRDIPVDVQYFLGLVCMYGHDVAIEVRRIKRRGAREVGAIASSCAAGVKAKSVKQNTTLHEAD